MNEMHLINRIYDYLFAMKLSIDNMDAELKDFAKKKSNWYDIENIVEYHKQDFNSDLFKYELYLRALRDKLNESEIL